MIIVLIVLLGYNLSCLEVEDDEMHKKYMGGNSDLATFGKSNFDFL